MILERTFVMVKPDGVDRLRAGEIISRLERKGFRIVAMKMLWIDEELAKKHYCEHLEKSFFPRLLKFITSGPSIAMVLEGNEIIDEVRRIVGKTNPHEAVAGSIRGDYGMVTTFNLIHASDSLESAKREIPNFFNENEIIKYERTADKWFFS